MRLTELTAGRSAYVAAVAAGAERQTFLRGLGFVPGSRVELLFRVRGGGVVKIMGVRVAMTVCAMEEVEISGKYDAFAVRQSKLG